MSTKSTSFIIGSVVLATSLLIFTGYLIHKNVYRPQTVYDRFVDVDLNPPAVIVRYRAFPHPTEPGAAIELRLQSGQLQQLIVQLKLADGERDWTRYPIDVDWFDLDRLGEVRHHYWGMVDADVIDVWCDPSGTHILMFVQNL